MADPPPLQTGEPSHAPASSASQTLPPSSADDPTAPPPPGPDGAPPTYAPTQPQILVVPLPDAPSFWWGRTLQGEVYAKGLGEAPTRSVDSLTVSAHLIDRLPGRPDVEVLGTPLPQQTLYPPPSVGGSSTASTAAAAAAAAAATAPTAGTHDAPFPSSHRFAIPLPPALPDGGNLPASLELGGAGDVTWAIEVRLKLMTGEVVTETVRLDGAPPDLGVGGLGEVQEDALPAEAILERDGVRVRLLLACARPRVSDALHIGVEVSPTPRARTGLAGLVAQPDPAETLRPLRRMRVELLRLVDTPLPPGPSAAAQHTLTHTTVLHASGKSLRYPGRGRPPLRLLFTLPTALLHPHLRASGGEITARTVYHNVRFVVRASLGFGVSPEAGLGSDELRDWCIEQEITIRAPVWHEPRTVLIERGQAPVLGMADAHADFDEEDAREAYRRKGRDVVGAVGTTRLSEQGGGADAPPPFADADDAPGPSGTTSTAVTANDHTDEPPVATTNGSGDMALPSFNESEAQMRSGAAPLLNHMVPSERLVPVSFDPPANDDVALSRRGSLNGELATWIEYDGYETFSMAPPPAAASFGADSSMDAPPEGEEGAAVNMGDMVARLGLPSGGALPAHPAELMEQLGLGQGTRVVDLQDDLPPGIDEPSLPALPGFGTNGSPPHAHANQTNHTAFTQHNAHAPPGGAPPVVFSSPFGGPLTTHGADDDHPPSFAASEAAEAVGGVARSRVGSVRGALPGANMSQLAQQRPPVVAPPAAAEHRGGATHAHPHAHAPQPHEHEAPPGYFGGPASSGGPPAYS